MDAVFDLYWCQPNDWTRGRQLAVGLSDLLRLIESPAVVQKKGDANLYIPAKLKQAWACNANVRHVSMACLDYDDGTDFAAETESLREAPFTWLAHTTFSHCLEKHKFRVFIPFAKPCPKILWKSLWKHFNESTQGRIDQKCKDPTRRYYRPSCASPERYMSAFHMAELYTWESLELHAEEPLKMEFHVPVQRADSYDSSRIADVMSRSFQERDSRHDALRLAAIRLRWQAENGFLSTSWESEIEQAGQDAGKGKRELRGLIRYVNSLSMQKRQTTKWEF